MKRLGTEHATDDLLERLPPISPEQELKMVLAAARGDEAIVKLFEAFAAVDVIRFVRCSLAHVL
jgi:hypothetical protein